MLIAVLDFANSNTTAPLGISLVPLAAVCLPVGRHWDPVHNSLREWDNFAIVLAAPRVCVRGPAVGLNMVARTHPSNMPKEPGPQNVVGTNLHSIARLDIVTQCPRSLVHWLDGFSNALSQA